MLEPTAARSASISSSSPSLATDASSACSTREPPSATIRTTRSAASGSASTRTNSRSRSDSLSSHWAPSVMLWAISSTKKALPSVRSKTQSTNCRSGSVP